MQREKATVVVLIVLVAILFGVFSELRAMRAEMKADIAAVSDKVDSLLENSNNFHFAKVDVLKKCTGAVNVCGSWGTTHSVVYKGRLAALTVSHFECDVKPVSLTASARADVALVEGCPTTTHAMNLTGALATHRLTDDVLAFGKAYVRGPTSFAIVDRAWRGYVGGKYGVSQKALPFSGSPIVLEDEWITNAVQEDVMSGAAVLNGCGYLGLAHARPMVYNQSQAIILPFEKIFEFLNENYDRLKSPNDCPNVTPIQIPLSFGKACS